MFLSIENQICPDSGDLGSGVECLKLEEKILV
jgi:hypothetical protein